MKFIPVQSTMIAAIGYDPDTRDLVAQFDEKTYYRYPGVDYHTVTLVLFSDSVGKAFNKYVKTPDQKYEPISAEEAFAL